MGHLPIRPRPVSGESTLGYTRRLLIDYGLHSGTELVAAESVRVNGYVDQLTALINTDQLPSWARFATTSQRFCSDCLAAGRTVAAAWSLACFEVCAEHRSRLASACKACGRRACISDLVQRACFCGAPYTFNGGVAAPARVHLAEALACAGTHTLTQLAMCAIAYRILVNVARSMRGRDVRMTDLTVFEHAADWLQTTCMPFDATVEGLQQFLHALSTPLHRSAAKETLNMLKEDPLLNRLGMQGMLIDLESALMCKGEVLPRSRALGTAYFAGQVPGGLSVSCAAAKLKVDPPKLRALLTKHQIPTEVHVRKKHKYVVIKEEQLEQLAELLRKEQPAVRSPIRFRADLGICRMQRRSLKLGNFIGQGAGPDDHAKGGDRLLIELTGAAMPLSSCCEPTVELLHPALWRGKDYRVITGLLSRMLDGAQPFYQDVSKSGLAQFVVPAHLVNEAARLNKALHGRRVTPPACQLSLLETTCTAEVMT